MAVTREATLLLMFLCVGGGVWGLGGYRHRNRHNQNYFSWGGQGPHDIAPQSDERRTQEELLEALLSETAGEDDGPCFGKRCTASEGCCRGAVCVDMDGFHCTGITSTASGCCSKNIGVILLSAYFFIPCLFN